MPKFEVSTPVAGFTGEVVGVVFAHGKATVEPGAALDYFRRAGYEIVPVDEDEPAAEKPKAKTAAEKKAEAAAAKAAEEAAKAAEGGES